MKKSNEEEPNPYVFMNDDYSNFIIESKRIKINSSIEDNSNSFESLNYTEKSNHGQLEVLEEHIAYFEFDISLVKLNGEELTLLNIKDVSALVKNQ